MTTERSINNQSVVNVKLIDDARSLSEVVTIGYSLRGKVAGVVRTPRYRHGGIGEGALAIFQGSQGFYKESGTSGDIRDKNLFSFSKEADGSFEGTFIDADTTRSQKSIVENASGNSIRKNFRDNAFWQPALITNENGEASFDVTFPDDVTGWNTYVLGIG
jgi:hypothetical protein